MEIKIEVSAKEIADLAMEPQSRQWLRDSQICAEEITELLGRLQESDDEDDECDWDEEDERVNVVISYGRQV